MADGTPMTASETWGANDTVRVDLPDVDTSSTRYYWTVVPVGIIVDDAGTFTYYDAESPQDACESGRMASFGKESRPVITTAGTPYVSGLSPKGRLLAQAEGDRSLLDASHRVATRCGGDRLRGAVVAFQVPVATARINPDLRDVLRAPAELRDLVLPRSRAQRRPGRHAGDDLVRTRCRQGRPPDLPGLRRVAR